MPWRVPATAKAEGLVRSVMKMLNDTEERQRKRKPKDQTRYERLLTAVVLDATYHHVMNEDGAIMVSMSGRVLNVRSRYKADFYTQKTLPALIEQMEGAGLVQQRKGQPGRKPKFAAYQLQSTITAGPRLVSLVATHGVTLDDIRENREGQEVVMLKGDSDMETGGLVEYEDTQETIAIREKVRTINAWIANFNVRPCRYAMAQIDKEWVVDARDRHVRRHFTRSSFKSGGRLFGGFWQSMKKEHRPKVLLINDCYTAELDYSAMLPRLLYGVAGATIPKALEGDPYAVPGFERSRQGIKKMFGAMLFGENLHRWTTFPKDTEEHFHPEERRSVQVVMDSIRTTHHPIKEHFGTGIGHRLQHLESDILVEVLLTMKQRELPGLPIHDAVIVQRDDRDPVKDIMLRVFRSLVGIEGRVTVVD